MARWYVPVILVRLPAALGLDNQPRLLIRLRGTSVCKSMSAGFPLDWISGGQQKFPVLEGAKLNRVRAKILIAVFRSSVHDIDDLTPFFGYKRDSAHTKRSRPVYSTPENSRVLDNRKA
jgi:hypothetical protein